MYRNRLLAWLEAYQGEYPAESDTVRQFESFVLGHQNCFERSCLPGHVTGSAWLLNSTRTHTLLTHHRKLGRWLQPGGHSDGDPNTLAVALREATEESGLEVRPLRTSILDLDVHWIPARAADPGHYHYDVRFLLEAAGELYTVSEESHELRWIALTEVASLTKEESVLRMVRKTLTLGGD